MSEAKRKLQSPANDRKKKKYRSDGTPIWSKPHIDGPGIWASCVKGREKQAYFELYDIFDSMASKMWPEKNTAGDTGSSDNEEFEATLSLEDRIKDEVTTIRSTKKDTRFANCQTNTPCVVFISCKPPVDPVELVVRYVKAVETTGVSRTRYTHRLVPVINTCVANLPEIEALCRLAFNNFLAKHEGRKFTYKIELRIRNHTTIPRPTLIQHIAQCVPEGHTVSLTNPEIFVLVEVFKGVFGVSIVADYYKLSKFNVMEISNTKRSNQTSEIDRITNTV